MCNLVHVVDTGNLSYLLDGCSLACLTAFPREHSERLEVSQGLEGPCSGREVSKLPGSFRNRASLLQWRQSSVETEIGLHESSQSCLPSAVAATQSEVISAAGWGLR
jgi:hypothetical protein